jgi:hypothetical protein
VIEFAATERKSLAATDEMLAFLRARTDKFTVINNRPMFADAADSKKYAELRKQIDDLDTWAERLLPFAKSRGEQAIRELESPSDGVDDVHAAPGAKATASAAGS